MIQESVTKKMEVINGVREPLYKKVPLNYPYSISVTTANVCNLRCEFCAISDINHKKNKSFLEMAEFDLLIRRLEESDWHLKQLVLVGLGEPLLNNNIVEFVKRAKQSKCIDKVHIVTNGVFLSRQMTDQLLGAGLDVLRVSLNGINDVDYKRYTGRDISYDELYNNLIYFSEKKENSAKLYVKIMNYQIAGREEQFYEMFTHIADSTNIEYVTEMSVTMDYSQVTDNISEKGLKGFEKVETDICSLPFYHIYYNAEGTVSACCVAGPWSSPPALVIGDLHSQTLNEIWRGKEFVDFQLRMLEKGKDEADPVCKKCKAYLSYIYPEDKLDDGKERIISIMKGREKEDGGNNW